MKKLNFLYLMMIFALDAHGGCPRVLQMKEFPSFTAAASTVKIANFTESAELEISGRTFILHFPSTWKNTDEGIFPKIPVCMSRETVDPTGEISKDCLGIKISQDVNHTPQQIQDRSKFVPHQKFKDGKVREELIARQNITFNTFKGFEEANFARIKNSCAVLVGGRFLINGVTAKIDYVFFNLNGKRFEKETAEMFEILKRMEITSK
jgi:hypothetical protein